MPGGALQTCFLQRLTPFRGGERHDAAGITQRAGVGGQFLESVELLLRPCAIALAQQIAKARGDNIRVRRIDQLQPVERLAHQIFPFCRFPQPHLFQQLLLRARRGMQDRHHREAER